jgi:uncharacterized membrane protein YfcA
MEIEPLQAAMIAAVFVVALLNTAVATTGGLLLAVIATGVPAPLAVPVHAAVEAAVVGTDWFHHRLWAKTQIVIAFGAGSFLGIGLAAPFTQVVPAHVQAILLGVFLFWACWWPAPDPGRRFAFRLAVAGAIIGACSVFVGATGGLARPFVADEPIEPEAVVPSLAAAMTVQHLLKIVAFVLIGVAYGPYLALGLAAVAAAVAGSLLGRRLPLSIPPRLFGLAVKLVVTLLALRLVALGIGWL